MILELMEVINQIRTGDVVGIGAGLMLAVRIYRAIPNAPWPKKHAWIIPVVLSVLGFVATMLTGALAFGMGWMPAIIAGLGVAVNAMGMHSATKAVGNALFKPQPEGYKPSPFRSAASILLPPPKMKMDRKIEL